MHQSTLSNIPQPHDLRRQQLKALSHEKVKTWGNTLQALREKKQRDRTKRLEDAELAQQQIDSEEAKIQEAQRRVIIDRANRILYQDTDRVKTFHTALLKSTAIHERNQQKGFSERYDKQRARLDNMQKQANETHDAKLLAREQREADARKRAMLEQADTHMRQLAELQERFQVDRMEEIREGERNKTLAKEAVREAEEAEARRQERMRENALDYVRANEEHIVRKAKLKDLDALEDAKITAFAAEKERTLKQRKDWEAARFKAKQEVFQRVIDREYGHLAELKKQEQNRTERQMEEMNKKQDDRWKNEERARKDNLEEMLRSRENQLRRAKEDRERQLAQENKMLTQWKKKNEELLALEQEAQAQALENKRKLKSELLRQAADKEERQRAERLAELGAAQQAREHDKREAELFEVYAKDQIAQFEAEGRPTGPLLLTLQEMRTAHTQFRGR